jgi:hypothetical protein
MLYATVGPEFAITLGTKRGARLLTVTLHHSRQRERTRSFWPCFPLQVGRF